jgi:hypothetical protein
VASLTAQFEREVDRSVSRIQDAVLPYTRFVRAERQRLDAAQAELTAIGDQLAGLQRRVEQRNAR